MKKSHCIVVILLVTSVAANLPKIDLKDLLDDATNQIKDDGGKIGKSWNPI